MATVAPDSSSMALAWAVEFIAVSKSLSADSKMKIMDALGPKIAGTDLPHHLQASRASHDPPYKWFPSVRGFAMRRACRLVAVVFSFRVHPARIISRAWSSAAEEPRRRQRPVVMSCLALLFARGVVGHLLCVGFKRKEAFFAKRCTSLLAL